ncbi:cytochrome P450 [Bacillus cereus]|uniref:cytochrome P450 n=1 Tax=Bacillus cereus TaxID=1396 RepID=UPI00187A14A8|nr:cytochrome P450 [Bacillus cereus]MBE7099154.1 cytochrome P450 [Bacillus cereus]
MTKCPFIYNEENSAWVIEGLEEAAYVLNSDSFRKPKQDEFKHGTLMSPSFFLALELTPENEHNRIRREFALAFSPHRINKIEEEILMPTASFFVKEIGDSISIDTIESEYIQLYCDKVFKGILGFDEGFSNEILAIYSVSEKYFKNDGPDSPHGKAALRMVIEKLADYCLLKKNDLNELSFISYMQNNGAVSVDELVYYILPFLEMIHLKIHVELPLELIKHLSALPKNTRGNLINNAKDLNLAVEEATRLMKPRRKKGPYISRVPELDIKINNQLIRKGERVVLKIVESGLDERIFENPEVFNPWRVNVDKHLAFGSGIHRCLGKSLVKSVASCAAIQLFKRYPDFKIVV